MTVPAAIRATARTIARAFARDLDERSHRETGGNRYADSSTRYGSRYDYRPDREHEPVRSRPPDHRSRISLSPAERSLYLVWSNPIIAVVLVIVLALCLGGIVHACASSRAGSTTDTTPNIGDSITESSTEDATSSSTAVRTEDGLSVGDDGVLTIVLDPGHGAEDGGTEGYGLVEDELNWTICYYCAAYLESYEGVEVVISREEDENPDLEDRALVAVEVDADLLVSLHINFNEEDSSVSGVYVYYPNETSTWAAETSVEGKIIATAIAEELASLGLVNNGAWEYTLRVDLNSEADAKYVYPNDTTGITDYYGMVRWPRMYGITAVLVEHAFLSNVGDAGLLSSEEFLKAMGEADARAILEAYGYVIVDE